jgi:hypothetical protein
MLMMQDFFFAADGCSAGWFHTASGNNTDPSFLDKRCHSTTVSNCASAAVPKFTGPSSKMYSGYQKQ